MYVFGKIRHASTQTVESCVSFFKDNGSDDHVTVALPAMVEVSRVMASHVRYNRPLSYFQTTDGNSDRVVTFEFGYQCVVIDDGRHAPMMVPIGEFEECIRHC